MASARLARGAPGPSDATGTQALQEHRGKPAGSGDAVLATLGNATSVQGWVSAVWTPDKQWLPLGCRTCSLPCRSPSLVTRLATSLRK